MLNEDQILIMNKEFVIRESQEESIQDDSLTPGWQRCPLCPGHLDESDSFIWHHLLNAKVCHGCSYDIHYALVGEEERPLVSERHNYSDSQIGLLEQFTGQTFHQLKFRHLIEEIKAYEGAVPEYVIGIDFLTMPESELRLLNKRLDYELMAIFETKKNATSDADSK